MAQLRALSPPPHVICEPVKLVAAEGARSTRGLVAMVHVYPADSRNGTLPPQSARRLTFGEPEDCQVFAATVAEANEPLEAATVERALMELLVGVEGVLRQPAADATPRDCPYEETQGGIVWHKMTPNGPVPALLTNFSATITADIAVDDGAEVRRQFEIEATLRERTHRFTLPASQFGGMNWATEHLGAGAIVYAGFGLRDHARVAIQSLSGDIPIRHVCTHSGWREINGEWVYLHGDGALSAGGHTAEVSVRLEGTLARLCLPSPPTGETRIPAVHASLTLLDLAPLIVSAPVLAAAWLAPLRQLLHPAVPDFTAWVHGPSGEMKSELGALAQAHYGSFTRTTPPASFEDTANSIERLLFIAKDALILVDDYRPPHSYREREQMAQVAQRLLRGVGNLAGRGRMRPDTSMRPAYVPRCLPLATGEHLPQGHSTNARMFPVPIEPGAIDRDRLTQAQAARDLLAHAMAAYIQWIAQHWNELSATLPARFVKLRAKAQQDGLHTREPGQVAHLSLGLETFTTFAVDSGALATEARTQLLDETWQALMHLAAAQAQALADETPGRQFLDLLTDGIASHQAYLEAPDGGAPDHPVRWGWERQSWADHEGDGDGTHRPRPTATLLGAVDADWLYLHPETVYQFVAKAARDAGQVFPVALPTLLKRLDEDGLIATQRTRHGVRRTAGVRRGDRTVRVIKLKTIAVFPLIEPDQKGKQNGKHETAPSQPGADGSVADVSPVAPNTPPDAPGMEDARGSSTDVAAEPPVPSLSQTGKQGKQGPQQPPLTWENGDQRVAPSGAVSPKKGNTTADRVAAKPGTPAAGRDDDDAWETVA